MMKMNVLPYVRPVATLEICLTVEQWAIRIAAAWRETFDGIIGVGKDLQEARRQLENERGDWGRLIGAHRQRSMLPFGETTAFALINISNDLRLSRYTETMPPHWATLHAIHKLDDEQFDAALAANVIRPDMQERHIRTFLRRRREQTEKALAKTIQSTFTIHHCAIGEVGSAMLADASVNAVITDPPYLRKDLPLFSQLANFADRVLVSSGWCVVMSGAYFLPEVLDRLGGGPLRYRWQYVVITPGGANSRMIKFGLYQGYKPVLIFQKPPLTKMREWWLDVITAEAAEQSKSLHPWQQSQKLFTTLVDRFSRPGDLVADPFAGSGTTGRAAVSIGRHFWGCDSDPQCATRAFEAGLS